MPDANTTPDDLIAELVEAAREFVPDAAAAFQAEARGELAAYRELRAQLLDERLFEGREVGREDRGAPYRGPRINVPEQYFDKSEVFIVFEAFVRFFLDPVLATEAIPDLLERVDADRSVERIGFARFEEEGDFEPVEELRAVGDDARVMRALAAELGRALFGPAFRTSDFWHDGSSDSWPERR